MVYQLASQTVVLAKQSPMERCHVPAGWKSTRVLRCRERCMHHWCIFQPGVLAEEAGITLPTTSVTSPRSSPVRVGVPVVPSLCSFGD